MAVLNGVPIAQGQPNNDIILEDIFWPKLSVLIFRTEYRVVDSIDNHECKQSILKALLFVTDALQPIYKDAIKHGYATFDDIPSDQFYGTTKNKQRFEIAVFSYAKAGILERFRDVDTTRLAGSDKAEKQEPSIDDLVADAMGAIRELLGDPSTYAQLI